MQAEEERKAAEEAAKQEAAEDPAVAQMRRVLSKTKSGVKVADAFKQIEVEGGLAGKWRVLYEVSHDNFFNSALHEHLMSLVSGVSFGKIGCMACALELLHWLTRGCWLVSYKPAASVFFPFFCFKTEGYFGLSTFTHNQSPPSKP